MLEKKHGTFGMTLFEDHDGRSSSAEKDKFFLPAGIW